MILFEGNGIVGSPSTPSCCVIHTGSYGLPSLFFYYEEILITVSVINLWLRKLIHYCVSDGNVSVTLWGGLNHSCWFC